MRALVTLVVAVVGSWIVSYFAQLALGIAFNANEELIVAMVLHIAFVLGVGIVFAIVLLAGGGVRALRMAALSIIVFAFLALAGLEAFALTDESLLLAPGDLPLLIEMGIPALLAVLIQWWALRRYLNRSAPPRASAAIAAG